MARVRKSRSGQRRQKSQQTPGWLLLLFGLGIGIAAMLLVQFVTQRTDSRDGLAGLFSRSVKTTDAASANVARKEKLAKAGKTTKPKFDFYTILPEVETVLPDKDAGKGKASGPPKPEKGISYVLQAASFANYEDADQLKAKLALNGLVAHIQKVSIEGKGTYHRVRVGPYGRLDELDTVNRQLRQMNIKALRLKVKKGTKE